MPIRFQKVPVLRHPDLLDKEINGVIDHADLSVTEAKLADGAVTSAKIASLAVTRAKIQDDAVDYSKLAEPAVRPTNIEADPLLIPVPAGKMLKSKAFNLFEWVDPPVGLDLLADVKPPGPVTQITITGLTTAGYKYWWLMLLLRNTTTLTCFYELFVNADLTSTNYYSQYLRAYSTYVSAGRSNNAVIEGYPAGRGGYLWGTIFLDADGYPRYLLSRARYPASIVEVLQTSVCKTATATDITQLDLVASVDNGIGYGSRLSLWGIT